MTGWIGIALVLAGVLVAQFTGSTWWGAPLAVAGMALMLYDLLRSAKARCVVNDPRLEAMGDTPGSDVCGCTRVMADYTPSDEEIVAYVVQHYSRDMAESVQAALRSTDAFADHVRRSFIREMAEPTR